MGKKKPATFEKYSTRLRGPRTPKKKRDSEEEKYTAKIKKPKNGCTPRATPQMRFPRFHQEKDTLKQSQRKKKKPGRPKQKEKKKRNCRLKLD